MPGMALGLSKVLGLSPQLTAGMVLVGSINGGQASNLCTYIARGDVHPQGEATPRFHKNRSVEKS